MSISRKRKSVFILSGILIGIAFITTYFQLVYKSPRVNSGYVKLVSTFRGHNHIINSVHFSPDGTLVTSASVDRTVKIWKRESGDVVQVLKHPEGVTYLDYSMDGNYIVTGSYDSKVRLWNIATGALVREFIGHTKTVWHVAFSNDGKLIASCGDDAIIRIWEVESGKLLHELNGHSLTVWAVKFSPDGTTLASGSFDNTLKFWNVKDGSLMRNINAHGEAVVDIAFSNSGNLLASTSDDQTIKVWNVANGGLLKTFNVAEHVQAVAFSPDDSRLITGGRDKQMIGEFLQEIFGDSKLNKGVSARLWDVNTGELLHTFTEQENDVNDVAYSKDGWIATASADNTVCIWKVIK